MLLVRKETNPEDIEGMHVAAGILTSTGGMTSHAAVVARGWGRCCVAGAGEITIDEKARKIKVGGKTFTHNDVLSIDGSTGEVMAGEVATQTPKLSGDFATVMGWADKYRTLKVRTNADTPADAKRAREFGAEGIGLCRTEHMFFEGERIKAMRAMILADNDEGSPQAALKKLLPLQRKDFIGIFTAMKGLPVTIRLLDPPLHEFLPHDDKSQAEMAKELGVTTADVKDRVAQLHEMNPMLGHRGCRLAVTYPEILEMQVTRDRRSGDRLQGEEDRRPGRDHDPAGRHGRRSSKMLARADRRRRSTRSKEEKKYNGKLDILVGTMIEIPRAALTADEIGEEADFFSFGTNDLTQMTFGFSRDDVNTFLPDYLKQELLPRDPFQSLDAAGVGQLVEMGVDEGPLGEEGPQVRHLRRARRRPGLDQVLPQGRARLRVLQPVPRADRPAGGGPSGARKQKRKHIGCECRSDAEQHAVAAHGLRV